MLTGLPLLLLILGVLLFIVYACAAAKWHPFPVLLLAAIVLGLGAGMGGNRTLAVLLKGSGDVFAAIGFVIALGTILGEALERTGAVTAIAEALLRRLGPGRVLPGMSLLGALIGIPVFCDSGFIILSRLGRTLAQRSALSASALSIALSTGLYSTHVLVPPTPGPLGAAANLGLAGELGWVILLGLVAAVPACAAGWWMARKIKEEPGSPTVKEEAATDTVVLPSLFSSLLPLLLPVFLIALGTALPLLPGLNGLSFLLLLCHPVIALLIGVFAAFLLPGYSKKAEWSGWIGQALAGAGPVLFITAAGGALGAVLKATPLADEFRMLVEDRQLPPALFLPVTFFLAAGLKTAQGSSTAALIITSSILAPLLPALHLNGTFEKTLVLLSIGGGAMTVSHANDSYFWVISQYGGISPNRMYRYFTSATFLMGLSVLITAMLLSLLA